MNAKQRRRFIREFDHVRVRMVVTCKLADMPRRAARLQDIDSPKKHLNAIYVAGAWARELPGNDDLIIDYRAHAKKVWAEQMARAVDKSIYQSFFKGFTETNRSAGLDTKVSGQKADFIIIDEVSP